MKSKFGLAFYLVVAVAGCTTDENAPQRGRAAAGAPFTFAVLGDNRGDASGHPPAVFMECLRAINGAGPSFVLNTGDMIDGNTSDEAVAREQWRLYRAALATLRAPMFHVPGNHDVWDQRRARLDREMWGPSYYAFDHGRTRFIAPDTVTDPGRLGRKQFVWRRRQLQEAGQRPVCTFLHDPCFPWAPTSARRWTPLRPNGISSISSSCSTVESSKRSFRVMNTSITSRSAMVCRTISREVAMLTFTPWPSWAASITSSRFE